MSIGEAGDNDKKTDYYGQAIASEGRAKNEGLPVTVSGGFLGKLWTARCAVPFERPVRADIVAQDAP